jgi:hypothetical protein
MSQSDILWILGILVFLPVVIAIPVVMQVVAFSSKSLQLTCVDRSDEAANADHAAWARQHGFVWLGEYSLTAVQTARISAWQQPQKMSYFCVYAVAGRLVVDFVTCFSRDLSLTTGNTRDGMLLPSAPRKYHQCFEKLSLDAQFRQHLASEKFLMERAKVVVAEAREPFAKIFVAAIQGQMAYIRSLFLWPLRGFFWYFVRRNMLRNMTVEQQVAHQWVTAPEIV